MFPIPATKLEDLAPDAQQMLLAIVNKAQPQASPFLLHTIGLTGTDRTAIIDTLSASMKSRKPIVVAPDRLRHMLIDASPAQMQAATYRLLQMLMEKRANIIFDNASEVTQLPLLRYAKAIGYKVSLCPASSLQLADDEFLPACNALGATLYELASEGDDEENIASAGLLGQQIAKVI